MSQSTKSGTSSNAGKQQQGDTIKDSHATYKNFLQCPPQGSQITKTDVDWNAAKLPKYDGLYVTVLDNCFTEAECKTLVSLAEVQTNGVWEQAMINVGGGQQMLITDARDCGRIIWDDREIVQRIWNRVKDHVPEILDLRDQAKVTGIGPVKRKEVWRMERLNERMRFLKYGKGQYFRPHCDGTYETPDGQERSMYTLHLYLNDSAGEKIGGGATTFHSLNMKDQYDVAPKVGRVLIFQHRGLLHSGAEVTDGIKLTMRTDLMYRKVA